MWTRSLRLKALIRIASGREEDSNTDMHEVTTRSRHEWLRKLRYNFIQRATIAEDEDSN